MHFENLNQMMNYIEAHLTDELEYKELSKIVGVSEYNLQRIFMFLTGISLAEYIRKRRLSKAYEELKTTDAKVVDLAVKYGYDSSVSFSRAFKQYFGITPSECKKSDAHFRLFSVITFHNEAFSNQEVSYQIKEISEKKLYCLGVNAETHEDMLFKVRALYQAILTGETILPAGELCGLYGVSDCQKGDYKYFVGTETYYENMQERFIEAGRYAVFEVGSENQKDIVDVYKFVYDRWLKSTDYELADSPEIEFYENDNCFIYFKLKDKQN